MGCRPQKLPPLLGRTDRAIAGSAHSKEPSKTEGKGDRDRAYLVLQFRGAFSALLIRAGDPSLLSMEWTRMVSSVAHLPAGYRLNEHSKSNQGALYLSYVDHISLFISR